MKRNITLALCATLALYACRKDDTSKPLAIFPQIPDQENIKPVNGRTVTSNDIVYTQIDKELSYNKFITIDADDNGKNDFYFTSVLIYHDSQSHLYLMLSPVSASGAKLLLANETELVMNGMWAQPLSINTPIGANEASGTSWSNFMTKGIALDQIDNGSKGSLLNGPWVGKADKYIAMQVLINGLIHYGWIHLSHSGNEAKMNIVDLAYNKVPGQTINAGQMQ